MSYFTVSVITGYCYSDIGIRFLLGDIKSIA